MQFPYVPTDVSHKHGGTIVEITGIGHATDKPDGRRSRDYWFYRGKVRWSDGSGSTDRDIEIYPYQLCCSTEAGHQEIAALNEALMQYLGEHGTWQHPKYEGWYANR